MNLRECPENTTALWVWLKIIFYSKISFMVVQLESLYYFLTNFFDTESEIPRKKSPKKTTEVPMKQSPKNAPENLVENNDSLNYPESNFDLQFDSQSFEF